MATSFKMSHAHTATLSASHHAAVHRWPMPLLETPGHSGAGLGQSLVWSLLLSPRSWCAQGFVCALQESVSLVLCKFWQLCGGVNGSLPPEGLCHIQVCCTRAPAPMAGHCYLTFCRVLYNERGPTPHKALISQFSSIQSLSCGRLFVTLWTAAHQASLSITNSKSFPKLMPVESAMPSNHLILCRPLLLLPSIFPSIRVFSNESTLHQVAKVLEFQLQHQSFQWTPRTDLL